MSARTGLLREKRRPLQKVEATIQLRIEFHAVVRVGRESPAEAVASPAEAVAGQWRARRDRRLPSALPTEPGGFAEIQSEEVLRLDWQHLTLNLGQILSLETV